MKGEGGVFAPTEPVAEEQKNRICVSIKRTFKPSFLEVVPDTIWAKPKNAGFKEVLFFFCCGAGGLAFTKKAKMNKSRRFIYGWFRSKAGGSALLRGKRR